MAAKASSIELKKAPPNVLSAETAHIPEQGPSESNYNSDRAVISGDDENPPSGAAEFSLPPVDRGKDAWLFLAACFVLEALVWGFPFSFGVFQDYYRTHEPFAGSSKTAVIGTTAMGIMYLDIPIIMAVQRIYPKPTRYAPVAGLLFLCLALAISSFSQNVTHLILTQGVLYAIGGSICYCPCMLYMDEWFVKRKGFAYGVMWSGTGLGGFTIPLLLEFFLNKYGFRTTLRIWALAMFILSAPLVWFIKPRLPFSATAHYRPFNLKFLANRSFGMYQLTNIVQGVGYFLPGIYLPTYARVYLDAGDFPSALTLLVLNVGSVIGCVAMGTLIDRLHVTTCLGIATVGTAIGTFFLWGLGSNLASLYVFCFVYGMFAGCYTSSWPGIMSHLMSIGSGSREENSGRASTYDPLMVVGWLSAGRGIGNVVSGPLSEALLKGMPWQGQAAGGYGSGYGTLIAFTGATAVVGGSTFLFRRIGWL
ncbi:major facilitator superfamily domain-containing protein [Trichoderma sp. SZMC 28013]